MTTIALADLNALLDKLESEVREHMTEPDGDDGFLLALDLVRARVEGMTGMEED